jgi:hypothetical protein
MLTSPASFAIDDLKLNSNLHYGTDSLDGPLITGEDAQLGFVAGKPNYGQRLPPDPPQHRYPPLTLEES